MEILSAEWLAALVAIILVDLFLAGDNAVVIAMAARRLPAHWRKRAIIYGTLGAILIRVILVFFVTGLLKIPGLALAGGLVLYVIAWRLLKPDANSVEDGGGAAVNSFFAAMKTIIIADVIMGLDNILAIAAAARGEFGLVIFGLALSIPIMMGGSVVILKLMDKFPWLELVGAGLLAIIAGRIILDDRWVKAQWESAAVVEWLLVVCIGIAVTAASRWWYRRQKPPQQNESV